MDEYERYCNSKRVSGFTGALAWWLEETQQKTYPSLSKIAVDILSIPAISAEPERLFSGAKITITDRRNRLGSDVIEALECLKSWFGIRPNFNFAVYLGSLTAINGGYNSAAGAILGFLGIFVPGLLTVHGTMGVWSAIRGWRWVKSSLRGVNAAAVGLIYTAVYRLWQIGHIDEGFQHGTSLAVDPWWVVVTATSYVGGYWFRVSPPVAIGTGAVMGLIWYGVVSD
ncbi:hypothetical protein QWA68_016241 [Fusarium oxysporum]|nr:hypothetical protein QWA68_016241 [Fusarium oxysporum]